MSNRERRFVIWSSIGAVVLTILGTVLLTGLSHDDANNDAIKHTLPAPQPAR